MESALPLLLFLGCLTGFTLLILVCGYWSIEEERTRQQEEGALARGDLQGVPPAFFATPARAVSAGPAVAIDHAVIETVERYLEDEQLLAREFVEDPSAERLHVHSRWALMPTDSVFDRVRLHLSRERELAEEFVSNPSVERLYGRAQPLVAVG